MRKYYAFLVFTVCNMFVSMSGSLITPFYPPFALHKGISQSMLGYIISANPIGVFLSSLIIGKTLTNSNRHIFLLVGVLGEPISLSMLALTNLLDNTTWIIVISILGRFLGGMGTAMFVTPFFGFIPILYPNDVEKKISVSELFNGLGMFAGPLLGGVIFDFGGFIMPFVVFSCFGVVALPFLYFALQSVRLEGEQIVIVKSSEQEASIQLIRDQDSSSNNQSVQSTTSTKATKLGYSQLLNKYPIIITFWNIMLVNICFTYFQPVISPYFKMAYDVGPAGVGYMMTIVTASYTLSCYLSGKVKESKRQLVIFGLITFGFSYLLAGPDTNLIGVPHSLLIALIGQAAMGLTTGPAYIPSMPLLNEFLLHYYPSQNEQAATLSSTILTSGMSLGQLSGPIISAHLTEIYGFERACSILGIALMTTGLFYIPVLFYKLQIPRKQMDDNISIQNIGNV